MAQLQACNSPTDILAALHALGQLLEKSTRGDDKLTNWLDPTIKVLCAFSEALGTNVGLVNFIRTTLLYLSSNIIFLEILPCEGNFCWCWSPPFGSYGPRSPSLGLF